MRLKTLSKLTNLCRNANMASVTVEQYVSLIPAVKHSPKQYLWSSYDAEADVLGAIPT